jgi:hypothetical protein
VGPRPFVLHSPGPDFLGLASHCQDRSWHDRSCQCGRIGTAELTQP